MPKNAVWIGVRRLCHAAKTKKEYKGIWSLYESSPKIFQRHQWSSGRIHRCHRGVDWREKVVSCSEDEKGVQGDLEPI